MTVKDIKFTLVSTVFNEAKRLSTTIDDLKKQTLQPSEIIITDAGSTDGTYEMLLDWAKTSATPIVVLQQPKCNVAEGRNLAIKAAKNDIIASTDFGCRFRPTWLESIISPFTDSTIEVVGGAFDVDETEQVTLAARADYLLSNGFKLNLNPKVFIPSSRSIAYKKYVFDQIGGYHEWLTLAGDDMAFGMEIKAHGFRTFIATQPNVSWIRHKKAIGFVKENFRYGLGNGEAHVDLKNYKLYILHIIMRVMFVVAAVLLFVLKGPAFYVDLIVLIVCAWSLLPYWGLFKTWLKFRSAKYHLVVYLYAILLNERKRISYIKGFYKGYYRATPKQQEAALKLKEKLGYQL